MGKTLAYKILENHLVEGNLTPGEEITIKIDQTLTQDSTGTMVYLQLEAMDIDKVQTELSVSETRRTVFQAGQRHLPPAASGELWKTGKNPAGI